MKNEKKIYIRALAEDYNLVERQFGDALLARQGNVYTFGSGDCHQLGHGIPEAMSEENDYKTSNSVGFISQFRCGVDQHNAVDMHDGSV